MYWVKAGLTSIKLQSHEDSGSKGNAARVPSRFLPSRSARGGILKVCMYVQYPFFLLVRNAPTHPPAVFSDRTIRCLRNEIKGSLAFDREREEKIYVDSNIEAVVRVVGVMCEKIQETGRGVRYIPLLSG